MAAVAAAALAAGIAQTGGVNFYAGAIGFKLERINPVSNLKNLFSLRAAARLAQIADPGQPSGGLCRAAHRPAADDSAVLDGAAGAAGPDVYGLLLAAAWLLFGWSAIDYLVEWQSRESRLKMSRQDLRDEYKETEGSPQIAAASATCSARCAGGG